MLASASGHGLGGDFEPGLRAIENDHALIVGEHAEAGGDFVKFLERA